MAHYNIKNEKSAKVALITGGSGEIGAAIVKRLADDGFNIVIHYFHSKKKALSLVDFVEKKGRVCLIVKANITKSTDVKNIYGRIAQKFGKLDVVINNAGVNFAQLPFENEKMKITDRILDINFGGGVLMTKYALPLLKKAESPRLIFISSIVAFIGSSNRSAYAASKGAIISFMRSLSLGLAPKILVNAVVPGYIDSKMVKQSRTESVAERIKKIPLKRLGNAQEVASVISFLCSNDSSYVTGQCLHVNGGVYLY